MLTSQKAQAVLELAILGALIIMAFSILITKSESYNRQQSYMQQTFRAVLKKAQKINSSASWAAIDFRRMPNVTTPVEIGELEKFSSFNKVLWSDGKQVEKPTASFQLNRNKITDIGVRLGLYYPTEENNYDYSYTSNLNSEADFNKQENGNITTNKSLDAHDTITGSAVISSTNVGLNSDLFGDQQKGGTYIGGGLERSRGMQ